MAGESDWRIKDNRPGTLALNPEDDLARSAAIVQAAGYQLVPRRHAKTSSRKSTDQAGAGDGPAGREE